jgi:hypothetical protein
MSVTLWDGIVIGSIGGTLAGLTIWFVQSLKEKVIIELHKKRVYNWLYEKTRQYEKLTVGSPNDPRWISTIEIASYTNLTKDRVRYICSVHKKIRPKLEKDRWSWSDDPLEEKWAIREFVL